MPLTFSRKSESIIPPPTHIEQRRMLDLGKIFPTSLFEKQILISVSTDHVEPGCKTTVLTANESEAAVPTVDFYGQCAREHLKKQNKFTNFCYIFDVFS